jgi:alanyl-tRNA synthetase
MRAAPLAGLKITSVQRTARVRADQVVVYTGPIDIDEVGKTTRHGKFFQISA